jgi:transcriptional regulator with XRE-family HTH domain
MKTIFDPKCKQFIEEIVRLRKSRNLSQNALAKVLGESNAYIANIELRERRIDMFETIKMLRGIGLSKSEVIKLIEKYV